MSMSEGDEPRPICGRLGLGEPIVKPTVCIRSVFCLDLHKGRMTVGNRAIEAIEVAEVGRVENPIARSGQNTRKAQKVLMVMRC
jgi:hypothetical protein